MGYIQDKMTIKRLLKKAFLQIDYTGNIDQKIESILVKLANEVTFEEAIKGKKFVNPKTKNKVNFSSLPAEEQKKIRGQFDKKVQESGGGEEKKDKKESPIKDPKQVAKKIQDTLKKDKKLRDKVVKDIKSPETKKKIVDGMKANIKEEDLNKLGDSLKNKDAKSFKQALPGVLKGLAKGLLIGLGVAVAVGLSGGMVTNAVLGTAEDLKQDAIDDLDQEYYDEMGDDLEEYLEEEFEGENEMKEYFDSLEESAKREIVMGVTPSGKFQIDPEYHSKNGTRLHLYALDQITQDVLAGKPDIEVFDEETGVYRSLVTEEEWKEIWKTTDGFLDKMEQDGWEEEDIKKLLWENGGEERAKEEEARINNMLEIVQKANQKLDDDMTADQRKERSELLEEYMGKRDAFLEMDPEVQMRDDLRKIVTEELASINKEWGENRQQSESLSKEIEHQKDLQDFANMDKEEIEEKQKEFEKEKTEKTEQVTKLKESIDEYEKANKNVVEARKEIETTKNEISANKDKLEELARKSEELEKNLANNSETMSAKMLQKVEAELSRVEDEHRRLENSTDKLEEKLKEDKSHLKEVSSERQKIGDKMWESIYDEARLGDNQSFKTRITDMEESVNVAKEHLKSLEVDISNLDGDIERSKEKVKEYESEQKDLSKKEENLSKKYDEMKDFDREMMHLYNKGTSADEMKSFDDIDEEYNKKVQEKALKRATMNKFSKANEINLELLAEKLQEKLSKEVSNCGEKKKLIVKDKPKKPKTNKKASREKDTDFDIKFI
jgi:hypothetical protein